MTRIEMDRIGTKSIVEKRSSDKRVRINEPRTKKDYQPDSNVPIQKTTNQGRHHCSMMNGKGKGKNNHPTKEMQIIGNRVIFMQTGMWNGLSLK
jgi:hypothetical protein